MGREISNHNVNVTVVTQQHSSIALLQERFRELQRVKAMREQREVLKLLAPNSEPFHNHHYINYEPSAPRLFFHPNNDHHLHRLHHEHVQLPQESISPSRISLSLWPTLDLELQKKSKHDDHEDDSVRRKSNTRTSEIPLLINLWPELTSDTSSSSNSSSVETCSSDKLFETATYSDSDSDDVDTSLHL